MKLHQKQSKNAILHMLKYTWFNIFKIFYLSSSLLSPPNATTVFMDPKTSSAIEPAFAYAVCS